MWKLQPTAEFENRTKRWEKKHRRELSAAQTNLATYHCALENGSNPLQIKYGFIHPEGKGVVAIDQSGHGKSLRETRLYVFPVIGVSESILYLITLGDKNTQKKDIRFCHEFVQSLASDRGSVGDEENEQSDGTEEEI